MVCEQTFAAKHFVHVAVFHLWFLLELPNSWYLRYDSHAHTCVALWAEIVRFCPIYIGISRPIVDALIFGHRHFGSLFANGRMFRAASTGVGSNGNAMQEVAW